MKKVPLFFLILVVVFLADRMTKIFLKGNFLFFNFKKTINTGAAFGLFSSFSFIRILLIVVAIIVLFLTAYFLFNVKTKPFMKNNEVKMLLISLALLFSGTFANFYDRFFYTYVIDFIHLSFWPAFPAFNLADLVNISGAILLIIFLVKTNKKNKR